MENITIKEIHPQFYAQVCPNCNGRGTVGYNAKPCPTCGHTDHKGIVYVPVTNERKNEYERDQK